MRRIRLRAAVQALMVGVIASSLTVALGNPASATYISCANTSLNPYSDPTRCYSEQTADFPSVYTGAWLSEHANNMGPGGADSSHPYMTNSEMWWNNGDSMYWVEAGLTSRWNPDINLNIYGAFWEDNWANANRTASYFAVHYLYYSSPDGSTKTFQISRGAQANYWNIYASGVSTPGISTTQNYWTGAELRVGGEMFTSNHGAFADTFTQDVKVINGNGNGVAVPGMPASQPGFIFRRNSNGTVTKPICCFNGSAWYNSQWSWNASIT